MKRRFPKFGRDRTSDIGCAWGFIILKNFSKLVGQNSADECICKLVIV